MTTSPHPDFPGLHRLPPPEVRPMKRSTLYSGIVATASMVTLVACQDNATGLRAASANSAKGPGAAGPPTTPPATTTITGGAGMTAVGAGEVAIYGSPCNV